MSNAERKTRQRERQAQALAAIKSTLHDLNDYVEHLNISKQGRDQLLNSLALIAANLKSIGPTA